MVPPGTAKACRILRPTDKPQLDRLTCGILMDLGYWIALDIAHPKPATFVVGVHFHNVDPATAARQATIPAPVIVPVSPPKQSPPATPPTGPINGRRRSAR